eukprot:536831-Rhodomonas_salina.1
MPGAELHVASPAPRARLALDARPSRWPLVSIDADAVLERRRAGGRSGQVRALASRSAETKPSLRTQLARRTAPPR